MSITAAATARRYKSIENAIKISDLATAARSSFSLSSSSSLFLARKGLRLSSKYGFSSVSIVTTSIASGSNSHLSSLLANETSSSSYNTVAYRNHRRKFSSTSNRVEYEVMEYDFETIGEMCAKAIKSYPNNRAFGTRKGVGADATYEWITYKDFGVMLEDCKCVLNQHNIGKNDKVAIVSNNRVEWAVINYAANSIGAQIVPMYEASTEKDWRYILNDSDAKLLIVATESIYNKTKDYPGTVGKVENVLCLESSADYLHSFKKWMTIAKKETPELPKVNITKDDIAVIIYTSGTTGNPKGVELSHANIVANLKGLKDLWRDSLNHKVSLAFLPWAHVYGQTSELHSLFATGAAVGIVSSRELILDSIPLIKPSIICSVPVLFNKVYDGVMKKINTESPMKKKIFFTALSISRERNHLLEFGKPVSPWLAFKHRIADKVVFSKIREKLGGNLQLMASGGAATSLPVLQFFEDIGIPICEGYGLTETSPVITASAARWETRRLGTTGIQLNNTEVRIIDPVTQEDMPHDADGEICATGPNVMVGYRNNPKANEEVFFYRDGKRYFKTGDIGRMVEGKFLKITGRIKEQFKLENGKYVVPAPLEDTMTRSQFIAQAILYGDNKPYNVAFIVPDFVELKAWAVKTGLLGWSDDASLMNKPEVIALLSDELVSACTYMKSYERPSKWVGLPEAFTQENQMLTPKQSIRRNHVLTVYAALLLGVYENKLGNKLVHKVSPVKDD